MTGHKRTSLACSILYKTAAIKWEHQSLIEQEWQYVDIIFCLSKVKDTLVSPTTAVTMNPVIQK